MTSSVRQQALDLARDLARRAGALLRLGLDETRAVDYKSAVDMVTDMDRRSEAMITTAINSAFPDHGIIAEEGTRLDSTSGYRWYIDPLDGTTNYAHGFPWFSVSLALEEDGRVVVGVIYQPMQDELFWALRGKGAFLGNRRLAVSARQNLDQAFLTTGFPYDIRTRPHGPLSKFCTLALSTLAIRRAGSAALDLACLATGRFDGFWEEGLHPWDTAAGWLMVEEAGGWVTDFSGGPYTLEKKELLATNGHLHGQMMEILARSN